MPKKIRTDLPFPVLRDFIKWLKSENIKGIIIGGIASSILGRPRTTQDIDSVIIINPNLLNKFIEKGEKYGFIPRIKNVIEFTKKTNVILMKHRGTSIDIDISIGFLPFEHEAIENAVLMKIGNFSLPLPSPENLIIMKAIAHRPKDLIDIESILGANPKLDLKRIRKWVREFSSVLEMPEISDDLEKILKRGLRQ
ncbi:MAG: nucleotidyl transferase AbiEii/AbiGii toxin family protein [bacterium]